MDAGRATLTIRMSPKAIDLISQRGGELFVWAKPIGGSGFVRWDTERPEDLDFDLYLVPNLKVWIEAGLWLGNWLEVRARRFPPTGLTLSWKGSQAADGGG